MPDLACCNPRCLLHLGPKITTSEWALSCLYLSHTDDKYPPWMQFGIFLLQTFESTEWGKGRSINWSPGWGWMLNGVCVGQSISWSNIRSDWWLHQTPIINRFNCPPPSSHCFWGDNRARPVCVVWTDQCQCCTWYKQPHTLHHHRHHRHHTIIVIIPACHPS